MAQKILIRRGTETERLTLSGGSAPTLGELLYTTDRDELFVGDGSTTGGVALNYIKANSNGTDQTITGNIGITGNLTVTGDVTQTTSNNVVIGDSIILLNADSADTPVNDAGFEIERGLSNNVSILWDEGLDQWLIDDGTGGVAIPLPSDLPVNGDFTLDGLSDTTITSVANGEVLVRSGSQWINSTLSEAGLQAQDDALDDIAALTGPGLLSIAGGEVTLDNSAYSTTVGTVTSVSAGNALEITGGSSTVNPTLGVSDNGIGATELNALAPASAGLVLTSTTGEGFTWESAGAATNNSTINLIAGTGLATGGSFTTNQASTGNITFDLDLDELTTSTVNGDGDFFAVVDTTGAQKKLTKANINLSGFNNDSGWTSNTGTVTSIGVSVPTGFTVANTPVTSSGTIAIGFNALYSLPTNAEQADWDTAFSQTRQWDGGSTGLVASTGRTSLGGTTIGQNMFTLTNPSAITFPRFNADNSISALTASAFRTAIGAGTSSTTGTVTNVASGNGLTGGPITTTGTLSVQAADSSIDVSAGGISVDIVDGGTFV